LKLAADSLWLVEAFPLYKFALNTVCDWTLF